MQSLRKESAPITAAMAKTKAKVTKKSNGKLQTTPAEGGVNIIRSLESESLVEAASTSPEVQAVVEQQAPEATMAPAGSDVKTGRRFFQNHRSNEATEIWGTAP